MIIEYLTKKINYKPVRAIEDYSYVQRIMDGTAEERAQLLEEVLSEHFAKVIPYAKKTFLQTPQANKTAAQKIKASGKAVTNLAQLLLSIASQSIDVAKESYRKQHSVTYDADGEIEMEYSPEKDAYVPTPQAPAKKSKKAKPVESAKTETKTGPLETEQVKEPEGEHSYSKSYESKRSASVGEETKVTGAKRIQLLPAKAKEKDEYSPINNYEILSYAIMEILSQFKQIGKELSESYKGKLGNDWVVPYIVSQLDSFNPSSVKGKKVNLDDNKSLEQLAKEELSKAASKPAFSFGVKLVGGLPEDVIYSAARKADKLKEMLVERGKREADALAAKSTSYTSPEPLVKENFYSSKAFRSADEHRKFADNFAGLFLGVVNDLEFLAEWFGGKTKMLVIGNKIKAAVNPMIKKALNVDVDPDWDSLPGDLAVVGKAIADAYLQFEEGLMRKRYGKEQ